MRLSIVSTLYRSAAHLKAFHERISAAARAMTDDYEIVLVNDGSPDDSLALALELAAADPHLRVVDLSRNFGHHPALWTGLKHARGEQIFLIDSDLEEQPEWLQLFENARLESGADVVFGVQDVRRGRWWNRMGGAMFYRLFNMLSDVPLPANLLTVRLMSRRFVDALLQHQESEIVIAGLWARTGFKQVAIPVHKLRRPAPAYGIVRRAKMFIDALCSFSNRPLYAIFYLGLFVSIISGMVTAGLIIRRVLFGEMLAGWPSLMASLWLLGGLLILCMGIIGIYVAKVFAEVKRRPIAIVREVHEPAAEQLLEAKRRAG